MARPSTYTKKLAEEICEQIATTNKGIATILAEKDHYPSERTFYDWLSYDNKEFSQLYARAKERQADRLAAEILEISDDKSCDAKFTEDGKAIPDNEWINRSRLRVDSRKWLASKLLPKKYGDKLDIDANVGLTKTIIKVVRENDRAETENPPSEPSQDT